MTAPSTRVLWRTLVGLTGFNALSAVGGSIGMLLPGGIGLPVSMLRGSPFDSFTGPAIILLVIVGGTQSISFGLALRHRQSALGWTAVAGFGLVVWIFVEVAMVGFGALQAVYFVSGMAELATVLLVLGILSPASTPRLWGR